MSFKDYLEQEGGSLGSSSPEMSPPMVNKGAGATASDEVKRTNLQPQVDAQELLAKTDKEHDKILAVDSEIEHMDNNLPTGDQETQKINKFRDLWDQFKVHWETIKQQDNQVTGSDGAEGLGQTQGSERYRQAYQISTTRIDQSVPVRQVLEAARHNLHH